MSNSSNDSVEGRLIEVGEQLQIARDTLQLTRVRLNQLSNEPDVDENSLDHIAAAALVISSREDGLPVSKDEIESAWAGIIDVPEEEFTITHEQLEAVGSHLDIDDVPPHPDALIQRFGEDAEMPEDLVNVGHRILHDAFEEGPTVVASGPSPAATAVAVLSLGAIVNGVKDEYGRDALGEASGINDVMVQNHRQEIKDLIGEERLQEDRYQIELESDADEGATDDTATEPEEESTDDTAVAEPDTESAATDASPASAATGQSTATDGAGTSGATSEGGSNREMTVDAVETEIDELVDDLDIGASTRLLARGMVGDAVDGVDVDDPTVLAGATVVAASRMGEAKTDAIAVAEQRPFEPRDISQGLDTLEDTVDADIPRRTVEEIVEELIDELSLSEAVRDESLLSLERYEVDEAAVDYTAAELAAGAVLFATTVSPVDVDIEDLSAISGANPNYVSNVMNSIAVSLCLGLVLGDIEYDDCAWAAELLELDLSSSIGDAYTGRVIAIAETYVAGREEGHIDDLTLDAMLSEG